MNADRLGSLKQGLFRRFLCIGKYFGRFRIHKHVLRRMRTRMKCGTSRVNGKL